MSIKTETILIIRVHDPGGDYVDVSLQDERDPLFPQDDHSDVGLCLQWGDGVEPEPRGEAFRLGGGPDMMRAIAAAIVQVADSYENDNNTRGKP